MNRIEGSAIAITIAVLTPMIWTLLVTVHLEQLTEGAELFSIQTLSRSISTMLMYLAISAATATGITVGGWTLFKMVDNK